MQIHLVDSDEGGAVPDLVAEVHDDDDGGGEVGLEEVLGELRGRHAGVADRREAGPELRDEYQAVEDEAAPRADHAGLRPERELVERVALGLPALPEADVREADGSPREDGGEAREGQHPGKGHLLLRRGGDECNETEGGGEKDRDHGAAFAVDEGEEAGRLVLLCQRGKRTG